MNRLRTLAPVLFLLAPPAFAGWSMIQVITHTGERGSAAGDATQKVWLEGSAAKIESLDGDNPLLEKGSYLLVQDGGKRVFLVSPARKTYARFDVMGMASGMEAMAGSGMEMKVEDPKMEKVLEEPGGEMLGRSTTHYRYHTTYTMVMSMPMGMKMAMATDIVEDIWAAPEIELGGASEVMAGMGGGDGSARELGQLSERVKGTLKGLPLKHVTTTVSKPASKSSGAMGMLMRRAGGGGDTKVTRTLLVQQLVQATLPTATFQIPTGYAEVEIMQRGPAMPDLGGEKN